MLAIIISMFIDASITTTIVPRTTSLLIKADLTYSTPSERAYVIEQLEDNGFHVCAATRHIYMNGSERISVVLSSDI